MQETRFGIIGCGLMGREFASAAARWTHLPDLEVRPRLLAICDLFSSANDERVKWFKTLHPGLGQVTPDYRQLLANPDIDAVYVAVPHHLHQEIYCACIAAGKHLMGEKPFGIDLPANLAILAALAAHPDVFVRCSSQFPFFPAVQRIGDLLESGAFGRILEVNSGFLHSSDLNPDKPINWKRQVEFNGEYGCLGDLGLHACHIPFRAGWKPRNVRAVLSKIVTERPDGRGGWAPCTTWDNALLLSETLNPQDGQAFPWTLKVQRIAPGHKNTWYLEILGTQTCTRFSTQNPKSLQMLEYRGGEQSWRTLEMGQETAFPTITGPIFEFGFSDSILQMWAAFLYELVEGQPKKKFAGCVTPEETLLSHKLFSAALESQKQSSTVSLRD
jgi:predicted dehydrogenase